MGCTERICTSFATSKLLRRRGALGEPLASISTFTNGALATTATLQTARSDFDAASLGDFILIGGGLDTNEPSAKVDVVDCTGALAISFSLGRARSALAAAGGGGIVVFAGGLCVPTHPTVRCTR